MAPRTALVTGANRGIGLAIAQGLDALGGYKVLAASRVLSEGQAAVQGLKHSTAVALDLGEAAGMARQLQAIVAEHGPIDILVNNAAVLDEGKVLTVTDAAWARSQRVNFQAPFELIRALTPGMVKRGWGRIVNVSSGWGSMSGQLGGPAAYSITKAGLNALTLCLSQELPPSVTVNAVCPGWVRTRMGGDAAPRLPAQGAETVLWLATHADPAPTGGFYRDKRKIDW